MVKKFIYGILGKREDEAKGNISKDDVPEELPPLAEDVIGKASELKKESKVADETVSKELKNLLTIVRKPSLRGEEIPEELPPLEESLGQAKTEEIPESGTIEDLNKESIPEEIKKAKLAKIKSPESKSSADVKVDYTTSPKEDYTVKERIKAGAEIGFFSNILEHIKKHGGIKEKLLSGDLFSRMDNYWELRKHEIKTGAELPAEKKLEEDLLKKLEELRRLEQKWQVQKLALEEDLKFIHEREREMQSKIKELVLISNELSLFRSVKPEEYFYLYNGVVLKNLHDIIDILEVIDEETFNYHVRNNKNDFSDWIMHVFKDNNLADKIKNTKTKMEMIEVLETVPVMSEEGKSSSAYPMINPKKYFWLSNGTVIRNLYELYDSLKAMDDDLFKKHVNENKNDFVKWVNDVLKNEHLAQNLSNAKTKKEMTEILEVFL